MRLAHGIHKSNVRNIPSAYVAVETPCIFEHGGHCFDVRNVPPSLDTNVGKTIIYLQKLHKKHTQNKYLRKKSGTKTCSTFLA